MTRKGILVTGGAGFIGSHLVTRLLNEGYAVRVVDNLSTGSTQNLQEVMDQIDFCEGDIRESGVCSRVVREVEVVFHVAALPSVSRSMAEPMETHSVNATGTLNLLEAARNSGVRRFVYSGSSSAYGDTPHLPKSESAEPLPRSPYAAAKLAGEAYTLAYARASLLEGVALRYFNVFGPRQDPNGPYAAIVPILFRAAMTGTPMTLFGDGNQTRDFTFVTNVVDANLLAATGPASRVSGHVVNVGAGARISLLELAALVEGVTGRRIIRQHAPVRSGDVRDSQASLERATEVLGYRPMVTVQEGIAKLSEWFSSRRDTPAATANVNTTH
jgi:UDP-glucose 4-epimerase